MRSSLLPPVESDDGESVSPGGTGRCAVERIGFDVVERARVSHLAAAGTHSKVDKPVVLRDEDKHGLHHRMTVATDKRHDVVHDGLRPQHKC